MDIKNPKGAAGKSLSEALIFASTNPQYDIRLSIDLSVSERANYKLRTWGEHVLPMFSQCSELVVFMYWIGKSMNNLLSYCGLVDTRISASEKDLPVPTTKLKSGIKPIW